MKKILIANRGEIASRIIRTCKRIGIKTVAIYSEADQDAIYTRIADEKYFIGPPNVNESYLNMEKIIQIAVDAGVDAIHPGYGFLSENAEFANKCKENDIIFIGPSADAIEKMGNKIKARRILGMANIPIIPGNESPLKDLNEAKLVANEIGYPVMLKASAGGGGIGMQLVCNDEDLEKYFTSNRRRAGDFFGDDSLFIEKLIENPRHIEIQLLADNHGNIISLGERECSIQRRHQKVIEEAPSPFIDEITRKKLYEVAIKIGKTINYSNAGTVEFIMDGEKNFYFLEVNTRLQVEHPITEEITGLDIVEHQVRIANDEVLSLSQDDIKIKGHAIEARIYAEDPVTFFPSPGRINKLSLPEGEKIRHEIGVEEGQEVTPYYDPMVGKLIVTANTRSEAIMNLSRALDEYNIEGIKTNIPLLKRISKNDAFKKGHTTTNFIAEELTEEK